jgi:hypothetical protein
MCESYAHRVGQLEADNARLREALEDVWTRWSGSIYALKHETQGVLKKEFCAALAEGGA